MESLCQSRGVASHGEGLPFEPGQVIQPCSRTADDQLGAAAQHQFIVAGVGAMNGMYAHEFLMDNPGGEFGQRLVERPAVIQRHGSALQLEMDIRHGRDINILGLRMVFI